MSLLQAMSRPSRINDVLGAAGILFLGVAVPVFICCGIVDNIADVSLWSIVANAFTVPGCLYLQSRVTLDGVVRFRMRFDLVDVPKRLDWCICIGVLSRVIVNGAYPSENDRLAEWTRNLKRPEPVGVQLPAVFWPRR